MWITLRIQDDGRGFSQVDSRRNFGLKIMHERAESVGGTLHIQSSPGHGTLVECVLPCLNQEGLTKPATLRNGKPVENHLGMKVMEVDERP
jgi:signal transduction histidine kinase